MGIPSAEWAPFELGNPPLAIDKEPWNLKGAVETQTAKRTRILLEVTASSPRCRFDKQIQIASGALCKGRFITVRLVEAYTGLGAERAEGCE